MAVTYTTVQRVSDRIAGEWAKSVALNADSGVSQTNKDRVEVADTSPFAAGDLVRITDDTQKTGEDAVVDSIVTDDYVKLTANMTKDYTTALNGKIQTRGMFNARTKPTLSTVETLINEAEDHIDSETFHGWRSKTATNEYHDIRARYYTLTGIPIKLHHRSITTFASGTDTVELWNGSSWVDWVSAKTESRKNDYWVNYNYGILYLRLWFLPYRVDALRVTYRYGESSVPEDIARAATLLAAADVLDMENFVSHLPSGDLNIIETDAKQRRWRAMAKQIINKYREIQMA